MRLGVRRCDSADARAATRRLRPGNDPNARRDLAHADDETPAGPILARYAREGARVFLIIASDGGQGTGGGGSGVRRDSVSPDELARTRAEEARRSAQALGAVKYSTVRVPFTPAFATASGADLFH